MISDDVMKAAIAIVPPLVTLALVYLQGKKVDSIKETGEANHVLQNSSALAQLKLTHLALDSAATFAERIATNKGSKQGDKDAAKAARMAEEEANKLFQEHEKKQAVVDAMSTKTKESL